MQQIKPLKIDELLLSDHFYLIRRMTVIILKSMLQKLVLKILLTV